MPTHAKSLVRLLAPYRRPGMVGVEIGVLRGSLSEWLLREIPELFLWMVDIWTPAMADSSYFHSRDRAARIAQEQHLDNQQEAYSRTLFANDRRVLVRGESSVTASAIPDGTLDFAFIDGDHTFDGVTLDIKSWWPKVRPGGLLAGHDYGSRKNRLQIWGVDRAVHELVERENLVLQVSRGRVWSVHKPARSPFPNVSSGQPIRILFGDVSSDERVRASVENGLRHRWARNEVVHFVAGCDNAKLLSELGVAHVELVCEPNFTPEAGTLGRWYMKPYLIAKAMERFSEILYLDFDTHLLRLPDALLWHRLQEPGTSSLGRTLQALNVCYRRPVCLPVFRNRRLHPVRQCLNTSVLYCRDKSWISRWLEAFSEAAARGIDATRYHDETFLSYSLDKTFGVLDPTTMANEFEIPIAWLRRGTPEGKQMKNQADAYFYHR